MAKTKRTATAAAETHLELDKTLTVNDQVYDITAVTADKVRNPLVIKVAGQDTIKFDGNAVKDADGNDIIDDTTGNAKCKEISIVSAEHGGAFEAGIEVPSYGGEEIPANAVLNYSDIVNITTKDLKNNSLLYDWDGSNLNASLLENSINNISLIRGLAEHVDEFAKSNYESKGLKAFLYVCTDTCSIYFGTSESEETIRMASQADTITSVLGIEKGGTGATTAAGAAANIIKDISITPQSVKTAANRYWISNHVYGINLDNSDLVNTNAIWFYDGINEAGEGIYFVSSQTPGVNASSDGVTFDRLYAVNGSLYLDAGITATEVPAADSEKKHEVLHKGNMTSDWVKVNAATAADRAAKADKALSAESADKATKDGSGNTISEYYQKKISISTKAIWDSGTRPKGAAKGDICIVY
jgi:hypothetical protein